METVDDTPTTDVPGDARTAEIVEALSGAIRDVVRAHQITEDEWYPLLEFLTEVGNRDEFILLSDVLHISIVVDELSHTDDGVTHSNVLGPFWRDAPAIPNPGALVDDDEPGEHATISGVVTDASGTPIEGATVDIWQCNASGLYDVMLDEVPRYRGVLTTGADGRYEVHSVVPCSYEVKKDGPVGRLLAKLGRHAFRPAHVHFKVDAPGHQTLVTQVYISGDEYLGRDTIGADRPELTVDLDRLVTPTRLDFDVRLVATEAAASG